MFLNHLGLNQWFFVYMKIICTINMYIIFHLYLLLLQIIDQRKQLDIYGALKNTMYFRGIFQSGFFMERVDILKITHVPLRTSQLHAQ